MLNKKIILKQENLEKVKYFLDQDKLEIVSSRGEGHFSVNSSLKRFVINRGQNNRFKFFLSGAASEGNFFMKIQNLLNGISKGYFFELSVKGIGYKCNFISSKKLIFSLGYSHNILYTVSDDVIVFLKKGRIYLYSMSKEKLGSVVNDLKNLRIPDAYKAKGVVDVKKVYNIKEGKKR
jgi:large subunit ribosomal protein L6